MRSWLAGLVLGVCALGACSKKNEVDIDNGPTGNENTNLGSCDPEDAEEPGSAGPAMRYVGKLDDGCMWVDETEVTAEQFGEFSAASDASDSLPGDCSADGWEPAASEAASSAEPVVGVDWCTAAAFCAWAGKRLCGEYETDAGRVVSELESTCTDGDNAEFEYSELTEADSGCNVDGDRLREAGVEAGCSSPTGVLDLVGNAAEWTAECDGDECRARGGSHQDTGSSLGCEARRSWSRDTQRHDLGFRCCAD